MGTEIERKFLVTSDVWRAGAEGVPIRQGYLCADAGRVVRVRRKGDDAYLTIKGATEGITRAEFEYPIPVDDAEALLPLCPQEPISKHRYRVPAGDLVWEVDEFEGRNAGLVIAEVELPSADTDVPMPDWVGDEVSDDERYYNAYLASHPFDTWG